MEFFTKMEKLNTWLMEQKELDYGRLSNVLGTLISANVYILNEQGLVIGETGKKKLPEGYRLPGKINDQIYMAQISMVVEVDGNKIAVVPVYSNLDNLGMLVVYKNSITQDDMALLQIAAMAIGRDKQQKMDYTLLDHYKYCEQELKKQKAEYERQLAALRDRNQKQIDELTIELKTLKKKYDKGIGDRCFIAIASMPPTERRGVIATMEQIHGDEGYVDLYEVAQTVKTVAGTLRSGLGKLKRAGIIVTRSKAGYGQYIKVIDKNLVPALKENQ